MSDPVNKEDLKKPIDALRAAGKTFGDMMMALGSRRLLAKGVHLEVVRKKLESQTLTDEALERLAADGFEAACLALRAAGDEDVSVFECGKDPML